MEQAIIEKLTRLTEEEEQILRGGSIRRGDYSFSEQFIVSSRKFLRGDRPIELRPHTRFVDFPEHGHDYMEFMYVYAGRIVHTVNGTEVAAECGDILFLNKHARHSIARAERGDVGINFILSDGFLRSVYRNVENNPVISEFLTGNFDEHGEAAYLFFRTKDTFPVRNLMDNLIFGIAEAEQDLSLLTQIVALLFSYLAHYRGTLVNAKQFSSPDGKFREQVLSYIRRAYPTATLTELAADIGYDPAYLSRKIARVLHANFQTLLQEERLKAAAKLLRETAMSVEEIVRAVGYENKTHFHALFRAACGMTPHAYRKRLRGGADKNG